MKYKYDIKEIDKQSALEFIQKYHYSKTLPHLNKKYLGFYLDDNLTGVVTLGWGTRPLHTIKKVFPSLETKDYYEIGRMCMTEEMPKNSESQMMSQLMKYIRVNYPDIKVIFTWSDGMLGKAGYVYQASNFLYAGYSETDCYFLNGRKIHPRETKKLFGLENDKRKTVRPTALQMKEHNIRHYRGRQFRYIFFTCNKKERKQLEEECLLELNIEHPKEEDLQWRIKDVDTNKWISSERPKYTEEYNVDKYNK